MASLAMAACIGFLILSLLFFWLSRVMQPALLEDAVLSAFISLAAWGVGDLCRVGVLQGLALPLMLMSAR